MEKRALIAFVLSLAVLLFWEYFFGLYKVPEKGPEQTPAPIASAPSPAVQQPLNPAAPLQSLPAQALPQDRLVDLGNRFESWTVSSGLYKLQVLAPGARINSFQLDKFRQEVSPDSPSVEMVPSQISGFLPMAVDLVHHQDWQLSTRLFSSTSPNQVTLTPNEPPQSLSLSAEVPDQVRVTKTFTFIPDTYSFDVAISLRNLAASPLSDQVGVSFYFEPYTTSHEESSYNLSHLSTHEKGSLKNYPLKDLQGKDVVISPPLDWIGYENNYFLQAIVPVEEQGFKIVPRVLDEKKGFMQVVYLSDPFELGANEEKTVHLRLYMGPKELDQLTKAEHNLVAAVDYGWFTFLAKPLLHVLKWVYKYVHNYGVAIILITVMIKIVFWPLTQKSYQSMQTMKKIQPKIAQVREKYKDDREKLNTELMAVYKTYKVNPMGGCLPMVLQIPVFFALYRMLYGAIELRHEPFMWWINDLTAPDRLHIGFPIPYLGGLPVLTILMGISMFIQQKMTPTGGDPRQEKLMLLMPVVFTVMFVNFPAGLVLYWLVNNILSIVQQYWINRNA